MNWDKMREELDATVRAQSVKVIDDAIEYLQGVRAKVACRRDGRPAAGSTSARASFP